MESMPSNTYAFLSYSHNDDAHLDGFISKFHAKLEGELRLQTSANYRIFFDKQNISAGSGWSQTIKEELDLSKFFIAMITPSYLSSVACKEEAEFILKKNETDPSSVKFIPIRLVECKNELLQSEFAKKIFSIQYIDCSYLRNNNVDSPKIRELVTLIVNQMLQSPKKHSNPNNNSQKTTILIDKSYEDIHHKKLQIPDNVVFSHDFSISPDFKIETIQHINLTNSAYLEAIITGTYQEYKKCIILATYDDHSKMIHTLFSYLHENASAKASFFSFNTNQTRFVLVEHRAGSSGVLSYELLSFINNELQIILERDLIFFGHVDVIGDDIIEMSGNQGIVFHWTGESFLSYIMKMAPIAPRRLDDIVFSYDIREDGTIYSESLSDINMRVGQTLHIRRTNNGPLERILTEYSDAIKFHGKSVVAEKKGEVSIEIIPYGDNFQNAKKLKITVE